MSLSPDNFTWDFFPTQRPPADPSGSDSPWNNDVNATLNDMNPAPWSDNYEVWNDFNDESLTLAPINPDANFENLPPLDDAYFEAPPQHLSPSSDDPFLAEPASAEDTQPPPSNQQAGRRSPHGPLLISQYYIAGADSPDPFQDFPNQSPPPPDMPPTTRSSRNARHSSVVDLTASSRVQARSEPAQNRKRKADSPGEGRANKASKTVLPPDADDVPIVDLVDVDNQQQYEEMKAREQEEAIKAQNQVEAKKPVKLAEFKCIICMDDPTDLTVTHCGHLFCSECLHQALHAGDRKCCPVCRSQIIIPRPGGKPGTKSYFPLSMKLMTANKKGKRPIRG